MYDLKLFDIFYEAEIMAITPSFCQALSTLLNDQLASWLLDFCEKFKTNPAATDDNKIAEYIRHGVQNLRDYACPRANILTTHLRLRNMEFRGTTMYDFMRSATLDQVPIMDMGLMERDYFHRNLGEVIGLLPYMIDRIEARTKENYEAFKNTHCADLDTKVDLLLYALDEDSGIQLERNPRRCSVAVADNKDLFYKVHEPARMTGLSPIIRNRTTLIALYTGLNYLELCHEQQIHDVDRRTI